MPRAWRVGGFLGPFEDRQLGVVAADDKPALRIIAFFAADFTSIVGADHGCDLTEIGNEGPSQTFAGSKTILLEHLQIEGFDEHAVHAANGAESSLQRGALTRLDGYYKGQRVRRIAGLLHDGANIDLFMGERGGDGGHDAGAIF